MKNREVNFNDYYNFGYVLVKLADRFSCMNGDIKDLLKFWKKYIPQKAL